MSVSYAGQSPKCRKVTLDLVTIPHATLTLVFLSETTTTGTTAADATFPPLSTNKFAMVIMKMKKKRKERNE